MRNAPANASEKLVAVPGPTLNAVVDVPIFTSRLQTAIAHACYCVVDDVPIPPLLTDLHHTACLLIV
jgi:hypothetical protein